MKRGRRAGTRTVVVHLVDRSSMPDADVALQGGPRVGFIVSKAVGNAVIRHRTTRRLRHICAGRFDSLAIPTDLVIRALPAAGTASTSDDGLITTLTYVQRRARAGQWRDNHAQRSIARDLPREYDLAEQVLCRILDTAMLPREAAGEAAYLAVFLHGWEQTSQLKTHTRKEQS